MGTINARFYDKNKNVEVTEKCVRDCSKIMLDKYSWSGGVHFNFGYDTQNGDVLFFFESPELTTIYHNKYATEFLYLICKAWKEAGFSIIEERICEPYECRSITRFTYFFRLRKRNVICRCELCQYSDYHWCSNEKILAEFANVTLIDNITIESSKLNCSQFSECSDAHDVE